MNHKRNVPLTTITISDHKKYKVQDQISLGLISNEVNFFNFQITKLCRGMNLN